MNSSSRGLLSFNDMPGPESNEGLPSDLANLQLRLHRTFGSTVRFTRNSVLFVSSTDPALLKEHYLPLGAKPESIHMSNDPVIGDILERGEWSKTLRKFIINKFTSQIIRCHTEEIISLVKNEAQKWLSISQDHQGVIDIQSKLNAMSIRVSVMLVFGQDFIDSDKLAASIHTIFAELAKGKHDTVAINYLNTIIENLISTRILGKSLLLDHIFDFTNDKEDRRKITKLMLVGSYHTVASTICWSLYALAVNPNVAAKLFEEVDRLSNNNILDQLHNPTSYLAAFTKEVMRMYPAGPWGTRSSDTNIFGNYSLPDNTTLLFPIFAIHRDPQYWSNPETFDPDRFLTKRYVKQAYVPFGMGIRSCPGINVANAEVPLILFTLLQSLHFELIPHFKPQLSENFVLESKNGMQLKISQRTQIKNHPHIFNKEHNKYLAFGLFLAGATMCDKKIGAAFAFILVMAIIYNYSNHQRMFTQTSLPPKDPSQSNQNNPDLRRHRK